MTTHNLKDDLIRDFLDQKKAINEQLSLVDPMAASLRRPAARHLFHNGLIVLFEIVAWLLVLGCIALIFLLDRIYPFYQLNQILHDSSIKDRFNHNDLVILDWSVKGLVGAVALLFVFIARMLGSIRMKNTILNVAGRHMKSLAEQMLQRKAVMENMAQRYPMDLPASSDSIVVNQKPHNDILL